MKMIDNLTKLFLGIIAISTSVMALQGFFNQPTVILGNDSVQRITLCDYQGKDCGAGANHYKPIVIGEYDFDRVKFRPAFDF